MSFTFTLYQRQVAYTLGPVMVAALNTLELSTRGDARRKVSPR